MSAKWLVVGLVACSRVNAPDEGSWEPPSSSAGTGSAVQGAGTSGTVASGTVGGGGGGPMSDAAGGFDSATGGGSPIGGSGGSGVGSAGAVSGGAGNASSGGRGPAGGAGGALQSGGRSASGAGGSQASGNGGVGAMGGAAGGGRAGIAGAPQADQCGSMPGSLLVSYPATNSSIDGGTGSAPPLTTDHTLRVWFTSPAGYCDETFGGSTPPKLTLQNDQVGSFALPGADLCFNGNMTGEIHIDPAGGFARVMGMGASWTVQGICVRVRRNHWDVQFHVNGDVDETWELWGNPG